MINPAVRIRLRDMEKPTIIRSPRNGLWYCGIGITQSLRWVAAYWHTGSSASSRRIIYAAGESPARAFEAWKRRMRYLTLR